MDQGLKTALRGQGRAVLHTKVPKVPLRSMAHKKKGNDDYSV